jgi:hypothetical protein
MHVIFCYPAEMPWRYESMHASCWAAEEQGMHMLRMLPAILLSTCLSSRHACMLCAAAQQGEMQQAQCTINKGFGKSP